jgi:hypothetical protein
MKLAKSRLSQDRENLTLWAAYARLERLKGNVEAARAVYAAAVNQVGSVPSLQESPTLSLVADWAYMEWSSSEQDRCLDILLKVASGHPLGKPAAGFIDAYFRPVSPSDEHHLNGPKAGNPQSSTGELTYQESSL